MQRRFYLPFRLSVLLIQFVVHGLRIRLRLLRDAWWGLLLFAVGGSLVVGALMMVWDTMPVGRFGEPKFALTTDQALHKLPALIAGGVVGTMVVGSLLVLAFGEEFHRPTPIRLPARPIPPPREHVRAHCPLCGMALTFTQISWAATFRCPHCDGHLRVPRAVRVPTFLFSLIVGYILVAYGGVTKGYAMVTWAFAVVMIEIWTIAVIGLFPVSIPLEVWDAGDVIRLRQPDDDKSGGQRP